VRRLIVSVLCAALLVAACSRPGDEEIATVGGRVITVADVAALFEVDSIPIDNGFRMAAFRLVALEVLETAYAEQFGGTVDEAEVEEVFADFIAQMEARGLAVADLTGVADSGTGMIRFDARLTVLREQVIGHLLAAPEFVAALLADPAALTNVCASHVLVATIGEAAAVLARLRDGEPIAAVADEVSLDTFATGGDLGCVIAARYVEPFALATLEAPIGAPYGPVETAYGFHVVVVEERTAPTAEEVAADPAAYADDALIDQAWAEWWQAALGAAVIEVNPEFGVWDPVSLRIIAPPGG